MADGDGTWVDDIQAGEGTLPGSHAANHVAVAGGRDEAIRRQTEHAIHNGDGSIQLAELLEESRRPGVVLTPDQLRALIDWSGTPEGDRTAFREALEVRHQHVKAAPLAPQQRRGHVSWLDRLRGLFNR